jgi:hypothetical protein
MAEETASVAELDQREREVVRLRERVTHTVEELERRGRELLDWRGQLRKHRVAIGVSVLALVVVVGAPIAIAAWPRTKRRRWFG